MKFKVPIFGANNKFAWLDEKATEGAKVGVNLIGPDGKRVSADTWKKLLAGGNKGGGSSNIGTTDDVNEGRSNLYFTKKRAQDAVGEILANSANVTLTYGGDPKAIKADLTDVTVAAGGALKKYGFDAKGRLIAEDDANLDDLADVPAYPATLTTDKHLVLNHTTRLFEWQDAGAATVAHEDSQGIALTGDGTPASKLKATPIISAVTGNKLSVKTDGLFTDSGGIHIDDRVDTYASLPSPPTEGTGATYLVGAEGLLYVWDGSAWPAEGDGIAVSALTAATIITTALAGSNHGLWLDCTDPASMYTDMAATTPVTVDGDAVAVIKDKSGLGFDASQSDPAKRAIYRRDGSGRGYLEFDGSKYYDAGEAGWAPTFTVMAYGTPTTSSDSRVIDTRGAGASPGGWQMKFYESATTLYLSEGSVFRSPGGLLPVSSDPPWLIVGLNDATSARTISISDTEQAQGTDSTPLSIEHYSVTRIGAASNDASQAMVGRMYQIFFVDRVLEYAERRRVQLALSQ